LSSAGRAARALLALALLGAGRPAASRAAALRHAPPVEAAGGEELVLRAQSEDALALAEVELRWRPVGDPRWRSARLQLDPDGSWRATVPAQDVRPPGLEYWMGGPAGPAFASERDPQRIVVMGSAAQLRAGVELFRHDFRRSTAEAHAEQRWYGAAGGAPDQLAVVGASYRYRPFRGLRSVRFGIERLRGATWVDRGGEGLVPREPLGFDLGSATLEFGPLLPLGLSGSLLLGADPEGFTGGAAGALRIGLEPGTRVELSASSIRRVGWTTAFGLHWATVPRVPMGAVVEVGTWPLAAAEPAVQGRFELHPRLGERAALDLRLGYQARRADLGGALAGGGLSWSW
jgi:hypothetical protein